MTDRVALNDLGRHQANVDRHAVGNLEVPGDVFAATELKITRLVNSKVIIANGFINFAYMPRFSSIR